MRRGYAMLRMENKIKKPNENMTEERPGLNEKEIQDLAAMMIE